MTHRDRLPLVLLAVDTAFLVWSGIHPHDRFTWFLEVVPFLIALPILLGTHRRFRLSDLTYILIALHAIILMIGGHYTYAEVPLFNWIRDHFHLRRNEYDHLGHFAQGFVPAVIAREILLRMRVLRRGAWLFFLVVCICLSISLLYELFEWSVAIFTGASADAFLGGQGDPWDTQKDMAWALVGALFSMTTMQRLHDHSMAALGISQSE